MKIVIIGPCYPFKSGWAHYNTLLYRSLKEKHDVHFIGFKRQYPSVLYPGKSDRDDTNVDMKENTENIIDAIDPRTWFLAIQKVRAYKPDLVIIHWGTVFWAPLSWVISRAVRKTSRVLFTCHNVVQHESRFIDTFLTRMGLKNAHSFIVHSREDETELKHIFPHKAVYRTYHPTFAPYQKNITQTKARKMLGLDGRVVLFFGVIRPYKGLRYLIEALPEVVKNKKATLVIAGEFWEAREPYDQLISQLGISPHVRIVNGYLSEEERSLYMAAADIVVLPYLTATQSGVVQNAFGAGKPVIVTNIGGLPDVVEDGRTGFIVPVKDPHAIADALLTFYKKNPKVFEKNIRNDKRFDWSRLVSLIEDIAATR